MNPENQITYACESEKLPPEIEEALSQEIVELCTHAIRKMMRVGNKNT